MTKGKIISSIAALPVEFYSVGTKSIHDLLRASGYFSCHHDVSSDDLRKFFTQNPSVASSWMQYSEDKRVSEGWFIAEEVGGYVVGYKGRGKNARPVERFNDKFWAIGVFVKNEVESIRSSSHRQ